MTEDLFKPVNFGLEEKEEEEAPQEEFPSVEVFKEPLRKIRREMDRIEMGTSKLHDPMYFPKGINISKSTLDLFERDPGEEVLDRFFRLVKQDYGVRVHDQFVKWVLEVHPNLKTRTVKD